MRGAQRYLLLNTVVSESFYSRFSFMKKPVAINVSVVPAQQNASRILKLKETCDRTSLSRTSLWRLRDELKPIRISDRRIGYLEGDVETWIASKKLSV